jgi:hypothetical protein
MSREKKFELSLQSDNGTYYRLDVYNNNASSSTTYTPKLGADGFTLTYQTDNDNRFTGIIPSEVTFDILVTQDGEQAVVNDIRGSVYGGFDMSIWKSSDDVTYELYWAGLLLNDISPEQDISRPTRVKLTAVCGLAPLRDIDFNVDTGYSTPSSFQTLNYFVNIFNNQIGLQDYYWSLTDTYITTSVDWTTDTMTSVVYRDPLVASRFNFMAYVEINEDGSKKFKSSFELLDNVCKAWGMRCFFSDGRWHLIQVNNYDNWKAPNTHYIRNFSKVYNSSNAGASLLSSSNASYTTTEGTDIKRYGGSFDFLPILRSVETNYNHLQSFDMPFFYYFNNSDSSTQYQTNLNEIPVWNGYIFNGNIYTGTAYDINRGLTDSLVISLGEVSALTGSSISINRDFTLGRAASVDFSDVSGAQDKIEVQIKARFKLVGASDTYYHPLSTVVATDWTTTSTATTTAVIGPSYLNEFYTNIGQNFNVNINLQTQEIPVDGDLFLEIYAICYYNNYASALAIESQIAITDTTTTADPTDILVYSAPESSEDQGIKYLIDNEVVIKKFFRSFNAPSGTTISNGVKLEIPELFIGSGPTSGAVGRIETYNYTTASWEDGTNATWRAYGAAVAGTEITQLLVEEVIKGQASGARVFNGSLKITSGELNYFEGIEIDGTAFIPYQVSYNANEDTWSGEWYGIDLSGNTLNIVTGTISNIPVSNEFTPW